MTSLHILDIHPLSDRWLGDVFSAACCRFVDRSSCCAEFFCCSPVTVNLLCQLDCTERECLGVTGTRSGCVSLGILRNAYPMGECPSWVCTASHTEARAPRRVEESGGGSSHAGLLFVSWLQMREEICSIMSSLPSLLALLQS